jgi:hypothetical protein
MRLTILIFLGLFVCSNFCNSQTKKNEFCVHTGYSQAAQSGLQQTYFLSPWRNNIHNMFFGIEYYRCFEEASLGIAVNYVEKGFKNDYTFNYPSYSNNIRLFYSFNYIEVPLILRFKFRKLDYSFMAFYANLFYASQGSATTRLYPDGTTIESRGTSPATLHVYKHDIGLGLRLAYLLRKDLKATATMTRGFVRPYKYASGELNFNMVFMFGLSYNFL